MRYQIENLNDLDDAKSFMNAYLSSCSYWILRFMMYFIIVVIAAMVTWSCLAKKDVIITAYGELDVSGKVCNIYIPNTSIGTIQEGDSVQLSIISLPENQYGVLHSKLESVSKDIVVEQGSGMKFYTAVCKLPETFLISRNKEKVSLRNGMEAKAGIVTYRTTYFNYFKEKLGIV